MANIPNICVVRKIFYLNINHMPAVKFFARLDRDPIGRFLDGHKSGAMRAAKVKTFEHRDLKA
jgi:hypothetical protein